MSACLALAALLVGTTVPACFGLILSVHQKYQEQTQWCWAGCSQAVLEFYGTNISQTEIAAYGTYGANDWNYLYGSDSTHRGISMILSYFAALATTSSAASLSLANLTSAIDASKPPVIRWGWDSGGGHFVVPYGIDSSTVYLMDPWYGPTVNSYDWVCLGSTHTWTHTLKLNNSPQTVAITVHPQSRTNNAGTSANFTVTATGAAPLDYQWQKNSTNIGSATNATYMIAAVVAGDAGDYRCRISNVMNTVTSGVASLVVLTPPVFNTLGEQSATTGVAMAFTISATGNSAPTLALRGTTASSGYSFTPADGQLSYTPPLADVGTQTFTFTASNSAGVATQTASVTIMDSGPLICTIARAGESPTHATSVQFSVDFTVAVTGFTPSDVDLTGTAPGKNLTGFTTSTPSNYVVTVGDIRGTGTVTIAIAAGSCRDAVGHGNAAGGPTSYDIINSLASVALSGLSQTYDGTPREVSATTVPAGLTVDATYDGSSTAPTNAGSYAVTCTVTEAMYEGWTNATLVVSKAEAGVALSGLSRIYDGSPKSAIVTTTPADLSVNVTYDGGIVPSTVGSYMVVAIVTEANYAGGTTGTLDIASVTNLFETWLEDEQGQAPADPDFAPDADVDKDGKTTWEEFLADTDPSLSDSVLMLTGRYTIATTEGGTGSIRMQFPASTSRFYQLEYCTDLTNRIIGATNLGWGVPGMAITNDSTGTWYGVIRVLLQNPDEP